MYPRQVALNIKSKNEIIEKIFQVTEPVLSISKSLQISLLPVYLSLCVLPGLDPQCNINKVCQDACIEINNEVSLLMSLFDGHGKLGQEVAAFCCNEIKKLYDLFKDKHVVKEI